MKSFRNQMKKVLSERVEHPSAGEVTRRDAIILGIVEKAMKGDLAAVSYIRALTEDTPSKPAQESIEVRVVE